MKAGLTQLYGLGDVKYARVGLSFEFLTPLVIVRFLE